MPPERERPGQAGARSGRVTGRRRAESTRTRPRGGDDLTRAELARQRRILEADLRAWRAAKVSK